MSTPAKSGFNPYKPPTAQVEDVSSNPEAEAIRKAHISHEASIKAVGALYYLGGVLLLLTAIAQLFAQVAGWSTAMSLVFLILGIGQLFAGWGVRAFRRWARILGCVLSALGLLGFPIGTIINGYILYLFLSKKGRTIFAPEYQDVIAATPHIKYKTSILVWIFLALLVALIVLAVVGAIAGR